MTVTRSLSLRIGAALLAVPLALAACAAPGASPTTDASAPSSSAAAGDFPRTITHAAGETTIPERPERVVVLDTGELDSMVALGIIPVGAVRAPVEDGLLDYLAPELEGTTELVGTIDEPNLEQIAALHQTSSCRASFGTRTSTTS